MKVMIVDDEPYLREGLRIKIGKMNLGLTVVGEAGDGQEAIEKLPILSPDIVLTDIRMPVADGLTFIREAKERYEGSHFIIVSGYEDFEYAKKGIQYDVQDYILKPVDTDELRESLTRMMSKIEEERKRASAVSLLAIRNEEYSRQTELTRIVQQLPGVVDGEREGRTELLDALARCKSFVSIVYELQPVKLPHRSFEKGDEQLLFFAVMNMISELLETPERRGLLFRHAIEERRLVYVLADVRDMNAELLVRDLTNVIDGVRNYLSLGITVGCGRIVSSQCQINSSYYQAARALHDRVLYGPYRVFAAPQESIVTSRSAAICEDDEKLLSRYLNECNGEAVRQWIERRVESIAGEEGATFSRLESFCVDLYLFFRKYLLFQTSVPEWVLGEMEDLLGWLHALEDWRIIPERMAAFAERMIGHCIKLRNDLEYDASEEVKLYIHANMHEQLTVQSVAERYYFHHNYFSRWFKKKFGESFVGYLTAIRMRKAEQLLRDTALKIQEIAELTGYSDASYFGSVFRKINGVTPIHYRAQVSEAAGKRE